MEIITVKKCKKGLYLYYSGPESENPDRERLICSKTVIIK